MGYRRLHFIDAVLTLMTLIKLSVVDHSNYCICNAVAVISNFMAWQAAEFFKAALRDYQMAERRDEQ